MIGATALLLTFAVLSTSALADQGVITSWDAAKGTGTVTSAQLKGQDIAVRKEQFSCQPGSLRKGQVIVMWIDYAQDGKTPVITKITCK